MILKHSRIRTRLNRDVSCQMKSLRNRGTLSRRRRERGAEWEKQKKKRSLRIIATRTNLSTMEKETCFDRAQPRLCSNQEVSHSLCQRASTSSSPRFQPPFYLVQVSEEKHSDGFSSFLKFFVRILCDIGFSFVYSVEWCVNCKRFEI